MIRTFRLSALALLLASPTMPGAIQTAAFAQAEPVLDYQAPVAVPAPQAALWQVDAAEELLRYVEGVAAEGLEPAAYAPERLSAALAGGDPAALSGIADETFLRLTADLSGGFVRGDDRVDWHMPDVAIDGNRQQLLLAQARAGGIAPLLDALLPTHPQYVL